ncbi:MAG TPA: neutral zinc metallopeptidase [Polyangia bacterium]|jgi:predicted metalloprotease|nr:neutral zinc metallopeptidase [Polyangia bacterium]
MRWEDERRSDNVEDRRGISAGGAVGGGAIIVAIVAALLGAPPSVIRALLGGAGSDTGAPTQPADPRDNERVDFVKAVLGSTEDVWSAVLPSSGARYVAPKLVLFSDAVDSACGSASAAMGPFYCPEDRRVYLDLSFFRELAQRFGAPGDFAQAYVVGHEVGHHVQNLLGISARVDAERQGASRTAANHTSVEVELQADCLAGVWAFHANQTHHILEPGDVDTAVRAASAIGDDTLQRETQGRVVPDSFTHGTSAQRVKWLRTGLARGRVADCDTFKAGP